jgi:hypothetical protein
MSIVTKEQLLGRRVASKTTTAEVDGLGAVVLRYPMFAEWYGWVLEQNKYAGGTVPPSVIAGTIALCLANADGSQMLSDSEANELLDLEPLLVMRLYEVAKKVVLAASEDEAVEEAEGN